MDAYLAFEHGFGQDLATGGGLAYVAAGYEGLIIYDVSESDQPRRIGRSDPPSRRYTGITLDGTALFTQSWFNLLFGYDGGLLTAVDVSEPTTPVIRSRVGGDSLLAALDLALAGDAGYVADFTSLVVFDVSEPEQPVFVRRVALDALDHRPR